MLRNINFCHKVVLALTLSFTTSCAGFTHYTRHNVSPGGGIQTAYIDAKQRAVVTRYDKTDDGTKYYSVCAEPSPDALSALAASQGVALSKGTVDLALNNAFGESAASIGLRTQSIQLMRDAMYRLCEAKLSGSVDNLAFETLHRRFQSSMVAILAIEQLTGVAQAPAVILTGDATAGNAELVAKWTDLSEQRASTLASAEEKLATAMSARDDTQSKVTQEEAKTGDARDEAAITAAKQTLATKQTEYDQAKSSRDKAKSAYDAAESARLSALAGGSGARGSGRIADLSGASSDPANVQAIATAVDSIVENTLQLSFSRELCTTILVAAASGELARQQSKLTTQSVPERMQVLLSEEEDARRRAGSLDAELGRLDRQLVRMKERSDPEILNSDRYSELQSQLENKILEFEKAKNELQIAEDRVKNFQSFQLSSDATDVIGKCNNFLEASVESIARQDEAAASLTMQKAALLYQLAGRIGSAGPDASLEQVAEILQQFNRISSEETEALLRMRGFEDNN